MKNWGLQGFRIFLSCLLLGGYDNQFTTVRIFYLTGVTPVVIFHLDLRKGWMISHSVFSYRSIQDSNNRLVICHISAQSIELPGQLIQSTSPEEKQSYQMHCPSSNEETNLSRLSNKHTEPPCFPVITLVDKRAILICTNSFSLLFCNSSQTKVVRHLTERGRFRRAGNKSLKS